MQKLPLKKFLPLIVLAAGLLVFLVIFFVLRSKPKNTVEPDETMGMMELKTSEMPVVSLTPTEDGHYLNLKIDQIDIPGVVSMDFQFLYDVPDKVQQGSSGDGIDITSGSFESDLLLGSESAGKFRYDEGVEKGNIMLWFRDKDKKLVTKLETDFHMQTNSSELSSQDGLFSFTTENKKGIVITMNTLGIPKGYEFNPENISSGPYGVFSLEKVSGNAEFEDGGDLYYFDGSWNKGNSGSGIFVSVKSSE